MQGNIVKGRIISAGLSLGDVCDAAGVSQTSLSDHLAGRRRSRTIQLRILWAFNHLAGQSLTLDEFWGPLAAKEVA